MVHTSPRKVLTIITKPPQISQGASILPVQEQEIDDFEPPLPYSSSHGVVSHTPSSDEGMISGAARVPCDDYTPPTTPLQSLYPGTGSGSDDHGYAHSNDFTKSDGHGGTRLPLRSAFDRMDDTTPCPRGEEYAGASIMSAYGYTVDPQQVSFLAVERLDSPTMEQKHHMDDPAEDQITESGKFDEELARVSTPVPSTQNDSVHSPPQN